VHDKRRAPTSNLSTLKRCLPCSWRRAPPSNQSTPLNGTIFMLHSHYGRLCPSFLSSHAYDKANEQALSPRSTHKLPIRCPSIRPSFLPSFIHSFIHSHYDKQLRSPARSTGHQPSTPSTALFMMHSSSLDITEARTHSSLVSS
jgi:hypothetical protein